MGLLARIVYKIDNNNNNNSNQISQWVLNFHSVHAGDGILNNAHHPHTSDADFAISLGVCDHLFFGSLRPLLENRGARVSVSSRPLLQKSHIHGT